MAHGEMTRREAGQVMVAGAAAAMAGVGAVSTRALAQPKKSKPGGQTTPPGPPGPGGDVNFDNVIKKGRSRDWTLKAEVNVSAFVEHDGHNMPVIHDLVLASAAVVFPVPKGSASHKTYSREVIGTLKFNDAVVDGVDGRTDKWAKRVNDAYPCGTRLVRWELLDKTGREVSLSVDIPMTCWATLFSRKDADMVRWPTGPWTPVAASTFNDFQNLGTIGTGQPLVLVEHNNPVVQNLVSTWCDGKDPKTIPPVALAEWLAGNVLEMIQPNGDGLNFNDNGSLEGFQLKGAVQTILDKRGNDQDISCVVAAVYRAAGLPARIVIGYDINDKKGLNKNFLTKKTGTNTFRSWVEFCLLDEKKKTEVWVPVDVTRQRKNSNKVLNTPKSWRYFGEHDELDGILPIAFQFHPPAAGVLSHGSPCFWGWFTTPRAQVANQYLRFNGITTPRTATTDSDRAADEELEKKDEQTKKP